MRERFLKLRTVEQGRPSIEEATGEPRLDCIISLGSQRKWGPGDRFRELAWDEWSLPIVPSVARCTSCGTIRV